MSDTDRNSPFARFLEQVPQYTPTPKEGTIFALGGRGYYENPASDLLKFFLEPDGEHRLGSLFLDAFFDCMEPGMKNVLGTGVEVEREKDTGTGGRLDLILKGSDGVLLIENKIRHHQNTNPFDAYKEYGKRINQGRLPFMAILSPDGSSLHKEWKGVSYEKYCGKLAGGLDGIRTDCSQSKWWIFAREFVIHLQNELYPSAMKPEQIEFAEKHQFEIQEAKTLGDAYRQYLIDHLRNVLAERFPDHAIWSKDEGWGIRFKSVRWGNSDMVWHSKVSEESTSYSVVIYLSNLSVAQLKLAESTLVTEKRMSTRTGIEGGVPYYYWETEWLPISREASEKELVLMAEIMEEVLHSGLNAEAS
ncbi:MAG: hypothetical protein EOP84_05685 [Verrucomicrobiaceae bacterium]|nr:MAG: hypothetical protein EOP84_05685 [Verrucomicrobiaceae bacterium]